VVEVSDTTLRLDRKRKLSVYARAQIEEYWIVNLVDRQLEVHREPALKPSPHYGDISYFKPGDSVAALGAPHHPVPVAMLFD
jgi:Uma2 family endonuclease